MLLEIYSEAIKLRTISFAQEKYDYLMQNQTLYLSNKSYYDYNLVLLYLLLTIKKYNEEVDKFISLITEQEGSLNASQKYLLKKCIGIYHFNKSEYAISSKFFDEANLIFPESHFDDYEKADLAYMNSLAKLSNSQLLNAVEIVSYATTYFQNAVIFPRIIECLMVEGIAFQRLQNLNKAKENFNQALKISENSNYEKLKAIIYQNLGSVNAALGNLSTSLEYHMNSLDLKENVREKVLTIFSIIQIYSRKKDYTLLEEWIEKGLLLVGEDDNLKPYFYHFKVYQQLFLQFNDLKFIDNAMKYFEDNKDYRHVYKYGIKIAEILKEKSKYKQATDYYQHAIHIKNNHLLHWEDL